MRPRPVSEVAYRNSRGERALRYAALYDSCRAPLAGRAGGGLGSSIAPFFGAPKRCSPGARKAPGVTARSTNGKCYPKLQAFPFERASPPTAVRRSRRLSSRAAEVTKRAAVLRSRRV